MKTWSRQDLIWLRATLARLYPTDPEARRVAGDAGLKTELITFEGKAIGTWFNVLGDADNRKKIYDII